MKIHCICPDPFKNRKRYKFINAGIAYVADILEEAGYEINRIRGLQDVAEGDLVLHSLCDLKDAYATLTLYREVKRRGARLMIGGQGVVNPHINAHISDYTYWGRAEADIVAAIAYILGKSPQRPPALQVGHDTNGVVLRTFVVPSPKYDGFTGCFNRCSFCHFSWIHKPVKFTREGVAETTVKDVLTSGDTSMLRGMSVVAIDGCSERLRWLFSKRITNEDVHDFGRLLKKKEEKFYINFYNVVGLPTERQEDYDEFIATMTALEIDAQFSTTVLSPMPFTPLAYAPSNLRLNQQLMFLNSGDIEEHNNIYTRWRTRSGGKIDFASGSMGTEGVVCSRLFVLRADEAATPFLLAAQKKMTRAQEIQLALKYKLHEPLEIGHHPSDCIKVEGANHIYAARNLMKRLGGKWE